MNKDNFEKKDEFVNFRRYLCRFVPMIMSFTNLKDLKK